MVETHPEKRLIGYTRVSTYGQTLDVQPEQLRTADWSSRNIYREKVTGADRSGLVETKSQHSLQNEQNEKIVPNLHPFDCNSEQRPFRRS